MNRWLAHLLLLFVAGLLTSGCGAAGATAGLFDAAEPGPVYRNFVETCLQEKGYRVVGWR